MAKFSVDESDSDGNSTDDGIAVETSKSKEENEKIPQLNNYEEVWENDNMLAVFGVNQPKPVNESMLLSILSQLVDQEIGKYFLVYWRKPKAYYWGNLLHVFSKDDTAAADEVEIKFLKKVEPSADASRIKWD